MQEYTRYLTIICVLVAATAFAEQPKLPSPPDGFEWQWCDEVRVGLLRPKQWHFKSGAKGDTKGYFITKEKIDPVKGNEGFDTGLTMNVISGIRKKSGNSPSDYAIKFVREAIRDKASVLEILPPKKAGPAKTFGCRIQKDGTIMHQFLIADDNRDLLYLFFFESPANEWDVAWKTGDQILKKLYVEFPDE
jgi:hypothetical protein